MFLEGKGGSADFILVVEAKDDNAVAFYQHHGFQRFASKPQALFLPLTTALQGAAKANTSRSKKTRELASMPRNVGRKTHGQDRASTESALLKRAVITIPAKAWEGFKAWIERPAEIIPALAKLARRRDFCT